MSARPRYGWENQHTPVFPTVDQKVTGAINGAVNTALVSLATAPMTETKPAVIVVVVSCGVFQNATPPVPPFCTGITGAGLTFNLRGRNTFVNGGQVQQEISVWWANSPAPFAGQAFTAAFQNMTGNNNFFAGACVLAQSYTGVKDQTQPWDTNAALPKFQTAAAATITTDKSFDRVIGATITSVANNNTTISGPGVWTIETQSGFNPGGGAVIGNTTVQDIPKAQPSTIPSPFTYANGSGASIVYLDALVGG